MKASAGTLVLLGTVLLAGPALAQSAQVNSSGATIAVETTARPPAGATGARGAGEEANSGGGRQSSGTAAAPVNGVGGVGGGRYTFRPGGIINNSETATGDEVSGAAPGGESRANASNRDHIDQDAQAEIRARRSATPNSTDPSAGDRASGLSYTTGDFAQPQLVTAPRGPGSPAPANVSVVRNSCVAPNTVELVTLSGLNTLEYTFQRLPNGPNFVFAGIANPTSLNNPRRFVLPNGTYRLTFRHPNTTPIGVWPQNVVIQPHHIVGGTCVPIDPRTRPGLPTSPVQ